MPHTSIEALLKELGSPNAEKAWAQFLSCYSAHIYQVIRHLESNMDHAADCFQYVCEQLIENRSRRLRKFKGEGAATFVTWLRAVVRNLCIDWHRKQFGRQRQFRAIARLPVFDQEVPEQVQPPSGVTDPNATAGEWSVLLDRSTNPGTPVGYQKMPFKIVVMKF